jgi:hypothetical protein
MEGGDDWAQLLRRRIRMIIQFLVSLPVVGSDLCFLMQRKESGCPLKNVGHDAYLFGMLCERTVLSSGCSDWAHRNSFSSPH